MINKSELMIFAWTIAKQDLWSRRLPQSDLTKILPDALRSAWAEFKRRAAIAAQRAVQTLRAAADLWAEIQNLENTDTLGHAGMAKLSELKVAYSEANTREDEKAAKVAMEAKRDLIASTKGQFCTVTFTKKDGSERQMRVQPVKLKFHAARRASKPAKAPREPLRRAHSVTQTFCLLGHRQGSTPLCKSRHRVTHRRGRSGSHLRLITAYWRD